MVEHRWIPPPAHETNDRTDRSKPSICLPKSKSNDTSSHSRVGRVIPSSHEVIQSTPTNRLDLPKPHRTESIDSLPSTQQAAKEPSAGIRKNPRVAARKNTTPNLLFLLLSLSCFVVCCFNVHCIVFFGGGILSGNPLQQLPKRTTSG